MVSAISQRVNVIKKKAIEESNILGCLDLAMLHEKDWVRNIAMNKPVSSTLKM